MNEPALDPDQPARRDQLEGEGAIRGTARMSVAWLIKWTIGVHRTHIDARLEREYVSRLTRQYQFVALANLAAAGLVFWNWQAGLAISAVLMLWLVFPPETPRYTTEAPIIEGEVAATPQQ